MINSINRCGSAISLTKSPVLRRNFCSPSSLSKENGTFTVAYNELHPDLKKVAQTVRAQSLARLGGAILYPTAGLLAESCIAFYMPLCVGTHHAAIRFAYQAGLEILRSGDIMIHSKLNSELEKKMAAKEISRFHINYKGDLVLHAKTDKVFSLNSFKGISLQEKTTRNFIAHKKIFDQIAPNPEFEISYFHIEEAIRSQLDKVLKARQLRFRTCMGMALTSGMIGESCGIALGHFLSKDIGHGSYLGGTLGLSTGFCILLDINVSGQTDKLWKTISKKNELMDIIGPKYKDLYRKNDFSAVSLSLSTLGNIQFSKGPHFSFRKQGFFLAKR